MGKLSKFGSKGRVPGFQDLHFRSVATAKGVKITHSKNPGMHFIGWFSFVTCSLQADQCGRNSQYSDWLAPGHLPIPGSKEQSRGELDPHMKNNDIIRYYLKREKWIPNS